MKRLGVVLCAASIVSLSFVTPVLAAAPGNDVYSGREVISALPFNDTLDTTEATTDADDAHWNALCGAPFTDASVWYELTATSDGVLLADTSASDYSTGVAVLTGSPGSFTVEACAPGMAGFQTTSGETYLIVAFNDTGEGGGTLQLSVDVPPPTPTIDVAVNPTGTFNGKTGSATVSGTVTCSGSGVDFPSISVMLQQQVGRFIIRGMGGAPFACDGTAEAWTAEVYGDDGLFKGGRATAFVDAYACTFFDCGWDSEQTTVSLRRG